MLNRQCNVIERAPLMKFFILALKFVGIMVVAFVVFLIFTFKRAAAKAPDPTLKQIADGIDEFLNGTAGPYEWQDFITHQAIKDPHLESIRQECAAIARKYPPESKTEWCNELGKNELLKISERVRDEFNQIVQARKQASAEAKAKSPTTASKAPGAAKPLAGKGPVGRGPYGKPMPGKGQVAKPGAAKAATVSQPAAAPAASATPVPPPPAQVTSSPVTPTAPVAMQPAPAPQIPVAPKMNTGAPIPPPPAMIAPPLSQPVPSPVATAPVPQPPAQPAA